MKKNLKNITTIAALLASSALLSGCLAPLVIGGGAAVGTLATREKGVTGTMSDSQISIVIKAKLYSFSPDLYARVGVNVQEREVLLTGKVNIPEWQVEAERLAWQASGVLKVLNNIEVVESDEFAIGAYAKDSWITTQLKSKILFTEKVRSLNYSIKTVGGVVYVMGVAQNQEELDEVLKIASNTMYVTRVVNYTKLKGGAE
ncbi:MAG: BON domain-containing protein [Candidatus Paracaedibacteraceae bacterium]|nr:BON domain-containing protein [Candidatus Paracaedibacteraceae bacterium]